MGLLMLDLDGTLIADALVEVETETGTKLQRRQQDLYSEPVLLPGVYDHLRLLAKEGDRFAIVTNQGGVAWGFHTQAECYRRISSTVGLLAGFWGRPFSIHVAFMHPRATVPAFKGDDGRKPAPTLLRAALRAHGHNGTPPDEPPFECLMVGDRDEDREAAEAAGVSFTHAGDFFEVPF